jgi:glycosyltransferase involved in cell wall biosynthesis
MYPVPYITGKRVAYACRSVVWGLVGAGRHAEHWSVAVNPGIAESFHRGCVPYPVYRALARTGWSESASGRHRLRRYAEKKFTRHLREGDIAYIWPSVSMENRRTVRGRCATSIAEQINCLHGYREPLLEEAYGRLGWAYPGKVNATVVEEELELLSHHDYIFAPSPAVADSLEAGGIERRRVLRASYGWDPERFRGNSRLVERDECVNFLFVGHGCLRKGLPWLLRAWERANLKGRLILFMLGKTEDPIGTAFANVLNRDDVIIPDPGHDAGEVYRSADVFVFPTHEEGSPLVSYEAIGCGLPCIVSPMGAGDVIRDGVEGVVLDPYDEEAWANAMVRLAEDGELRAALGAAARERAADFTWEAVGRRRASEIARCETRPKP